MKVDFKRLTWENYPSTETPINADNLNRLEEGVAGLYSDMRDIEEELDGGVGEYVTDWLNEHVNPAGSAVVVDDTLTIQGAAADAKKTGDEIFGLKENYSDILNSAYVTDTASGSVASFPDGAGNVPVKSLTVAIEPVQEGSGDPSPDNVRPISGHTQASVTVSPTTDAEDGTTYTIDLDGTRYGGTLDVTTGVLTVDRQIVDMGTLNWSRAETTSGSDNPYRWFTDASGLGNFGGAITEINCVSSMYAGISYGRLIAGRNNAVCSTEKRGYINIVDTAKNDMSPADFKTSLVGQAILYKLNEPITIQLTANEISTLLGQNNIWSDAGTLDVEYRADTKLYIQKVLNA